MLGKGTGDKETYETDKIFLGEKLKIIHELAGFYVDSLSSCS